MTEKEKKKGVSFIISYVRMGNGKCHVFRVHKGKPFNPELEGDVSGSWESSQEILSSQTGSQQDRKILMEAVEFAKEQVYLKTVSTVGWCLGWRKRKLNAALSSHIVRCNTQAVP